MLGARRRLSAGKFLLLVVRRSASRPITARVERQLWVGVRQLAQTVRRTKADVGVGPSSSGRPAPVISAISGLSRTAALEQHRLLPAPLLGRSHGLSKSALKIFQGRPKPMLRRW